MSLEHALVPISSALIHWADEIVFMDFNVFSAFTEDDDNKQLIKEVKDTCTDVFILNVPDDFNWNDSVLRETSVMQYLEKRKFKDME